MTFNRQCRHLDITRMDSNRTERGVIGGENASVQTNFHPCLSADNPEEWVSECPDDCPYFEPRII